MYSDRGVKDAGPCRWVNTRLFERSWRIIVSSYLCSLCAVSVFFQPLILMHFQGTSKSCDKLCCQQTLAAYIIVGRCGLTEKVASFKIGTVKSMPVA
jgi:hypothetical protein